MTVKLDEDVIMGEIVNDKRYHSQGLGSVEDLCSVCSCTCVTCHHNFTPEMLKAEENEVYHHPPYIQTITKPLPAQDQSQCMRSDPVNTPTVTMACS